MANTQTIKMRIQFRRDTAANWLLHKDIVPAAGEPCFEVDTGIFKIGDGVTTYENLKEIGGASLSADGKSIVLSDGVFKLAGFDEADVGAQPRKNANGEIEWVVPSTETVEGLQTSVAGLQSDVKTLQEIIGSAEGEDTLISRVGTLEEQVGILNGNDTVEGSVLKTVRDEINAFATKVSDDGTVNTIKELIDYVTAHGPEVAEMAADITDLQTLVGNSSVADQIAAAISSSGHLSKKEAAATLQYVKYEISHKPVGTLVDYGDKEIRVMVPADNKFELQNSGENSDSNSYYIGFKAYAPEGAVSFKEDLAEIISDETMYTFDGNDFAGIDAYGRKYSIVWLPVASYNAEANAWSYYGAMSSKEKYIGWYYSVEWYNVDGKKIDSDCIRINLSNESCHNIVEPYYMSNVVKSVSIGGTLLDVIDGKVEIPAGAGLKSSDEIIIAEDGTVSIKTISFDKIVQNEESILVMDGGSAN